MYSRFRNRVSRLAASPTIRRIAVAATATAVLFGIGATAAIYLLKVQKNFDCEFADGCFQIYNPLRRWAAGQAPGHDFQFFYGLGTLWLHYLPFRLFGGDLMASEIARTLLLPLCFLSATYLVLRSACGRLYSIVGVSLFGYFALLYMPTLVRTSSDPMTVRSFLAVSMAAGLIWLSAAKTTRSRTVRTLAIGALAGLAFFVSHDQGIATFAAGLLTIAICTPGRWPQRLRSVTAFIAMGAGTAVLAYALVAGPYWRESLHYNLSEASGDQFWYFGVEPIAFLGRWLIEHQPRRLLMLFGVPAIAVIAMGFFRKIIAPQHRPAIFYLSTYGLLSITPILAQFHTQYFFILWWCLGLCGLIIAWDVRQRITRQIGKWSPVVAAAGLLLLFLAAVHVDLPIRKTLAKNMVAPKSSSHIVLGVSPSIRWREDMYLIDDLIAASPRPVTGIWSTYASLPEASRRWFHPDTDYIIHALGPVRRQRYVDTFERVQPPIVRTTMDNWSFEHWLWFTHWDFYETLLLNYKFADNDRVMAAWTRTENEWRSPDSLPWTGDIAVMNGNATAPIGPVGPDKLITARLEYEIRNPWSWLPIFGRTPRYIAFFSGMKNAHPATLSPDQEYVTMPLIEPLSSAGLRVQARTFLPFVSIRLKSVKYRFVELGEDEKKFIGL